eukprot:CCRYP_018573-RN/>CCRYP_018573-RN protein AED:0.45 eAED:0.45 QI:0/-1/0/1/-1/0/1/0/51
MDMRFHWLCDRATRTISHLLATRQIKLRRLLDETSSSQAPPKSRGISSLLS